MMPTPEVQKRIRRYLLGQLTDGAWEEIEQQILLDENLFEELQLAEDELIDEYLAGSLSVEERVLFEGHFLATPERHYKLNFGRAFGRYLSSQMPMDITAGKNAAGAKSLGINFNSITTRRPLFATVLAVIGIGVWWIVFHQSAAEKGQLAFNAAYSRQRPVKARLSLLRYAPYANTRGSEDKTVNEIELRRAEVILRNEPESDSNSAVQHTLGEVYLAKGQFDDAIRELGGALKTDPGNPSLLSDLGAVWLEKGKIDRDGLDPAKERSEFILSLESLNKSLALNANLPEAIFNRALCHEALMQPMEASQDWRRYLQLDSGSPWAAEANQHLKDIEKMAYPGPH